MPNTNNESNTSNYSLWNSVSRIWQHSQQVIKGATLVTFAAKTQEYKNESQELSHNGTALKTINPVVNV